MKRNVLLILFGLFALSFIGCGDTEEKANLSFTNSTSSDGKINDIMWAGGNETWNSTTGYDRGGTTEQKEVTKRNGEVSASLEDNSGNYNAAEITIPESNSQSLSLADGSTNKYTIVATSGASAPKKK